MVIWLRVLGAALFAAPLAVAPWPGEVAHTALVVFLCLDGAILLACTGIIARLTRGVPVLAASGTISALAVGMGFLAPQPKTILLLAISVFWVAAARLNGKLAPLLFDAPCTFNPVKDDSASGMCVRILMFFQMLMAGILSAVLLGLAQHFFGWRIV